MNLQTFWQHIETAKRASEGNPERQVELLSQALAALPADELLAFASVFDGLMRRSCTHELWAAAYIINGGCSDDCFDYFRAWLVAQGEAVFEAALHDPESLADLAGAEEGAVELEDMLYVAADVYENKTGHELPGHSGTPRQLTGVAWNDDNVMELYPRLAARFG